MSPSRCNSWKAICLEMEGASFFTEGNVMDLLLHEPQRSPSCRVTHGANDGQFAVVGKPVVWVYRALRTLFNLPADAYALINGVKVKPHYRLRLGDHVEWVRRSRRKCVSPRQTDLSTNPNLGVITVTVKEAAKELACSISFVYKLMRERQIAFERRGRRKFPVNSSVAEYQQRNFVAAKPKPIKSKASSGPYRYKHLFQDE